MFSFLGTRAVTDPRLRVAVTDRHAERPRERPRAGGAGAEQLRCSVAGMPADERALAGALRSPRRCVVAAGQSEYGWGHSTRERERV